MQGAASHSTNVHARARKRTRTWARDSCRLHAHKHMHPSQAPSERQPEQTISLCRERGRRGRMAACRHPAGHIAEGHATQCAPMSSSWPHTGHVRLQACHKCRSFWLAQAARLVKAGSGDTTPLAISIRGPDGSDRKVEDGAPDRYQPPAPLQSRCFENDEAGGSPGRGVGHRGPARRLLTRGFERRTSSFARHPPQQTTVQHASPCSAPVS